MSLPSIVGLLGRSRSGKDTVAGCLQRLYPEQEFRVVRLSQPIKDAARALFVLSDEQIEGDLKEVRDVRWNVSPRTIFQTLTEEIMGRMGTDFFTRVLYEKYEQGQLGPHILIPDIRYRHDIDEILQRGGWVWKIERSDLPVKYGCEDHLDQIVHLPTLVNDGSVLELEEKIKSLVKMNLVARGRT